MYPPCLHCYSTHGFYSADPKKYCTACPDKIPFMNSAPTTCAEVEARRAHRAHTEALDNSACNIGARSPFPVECKAASPWRKLSDYHALPLPIPVEDSGFVLLRYGSGYIESAHFSTIQGRIRAEGGFHCSVPEYWMPLPKAQSAGVSHCEHEQLKAQLADAKTISATRLSDAESIGYRHASIAMERLRKELADAKNYSIAVTPAYERVCRELDDLKSKLRTQWKDCEMFLNRALEGRLDFKCYSESLQAAFAKVWKQAQELNFTKSQLDAIRLTLG